MQELDLFGEPVVDNKAPSLVDRFGENPFTILNTQTGRWQNRKRWWINLGIKSEVGRTATAYNTKEWVDKVRSEGKMQGNLLLSNTSIFDPVLCELMYRWFCPDGGRILDPFAGGSARGIVAHYLGYKYSGIDIRQEQVDSNREQAMNILDVNNQPQWYVGDSNKVLDGDWNTEFDMVFSCPPYADLEKYSDMEDDISNMPYEKFLSVYESIIAKACNKLKKGGHAVFVVGEIRDKHGYYRGFVPHTINAFWKCGMKLYNEAILQNSLAACAIRAAGNMKSSKLVKVHQNILDFVKA